MMMEFFLSKKVFYASRKIENEKEMNVSRDLKLSIGAQHSSSIKNVRQLRTVWDGTTVRRKMPLKSMLELLFSMKLD